MLLELTKTNQEIQKIVAFEGAFDQLFEIMKDEGSDSIFQSSVNFTTIPTKCCHIPFFFSLFI